MALPNYDNLVILRVFSHGVKWLLIVNTAVFVLYYLGGARGPEPPLTLFGAGRRRW